MVVDFIFLDRNVNFVKEIGYFEEMKEFLQKDCGS